MNCYFQLVASFKGFISKSCLSSPVATKLHTVHKDGRRRGDVTRWFVNARFEAQSFTVSNMLSFRVYRRLFRRPTAMLTTSLTLWSFLFKPGPNIFTSN